MAWRRPWRCIFDAVHSKREPPPPQCALLGKLEVEGICHGGSCTRVRDVRAQDARGAQHIQLGAHPARSTQRARRFEWRGSFASSASQKALTSALRPATLPTRATLMPASPTASGSNVVAMAQGKLEPVSVKLQKPPASPAGRSLCQRPHPLRAAATLKQGDMAACAAAAKDEQIHKVSVQNKNLAKKAAKAKGRSVSLPAIYTPFLEVAARCTRSARPLELNVKDVAAFHVEPIVHVLSLPHRHLPFQPFPDIPRTAPRRRLGRRHDVRVQWHHALTMIVVAEGSSLGAVVHPLMLNNKLRSRLGFDSAVRASAAWGSSADEEQEQDNDAQHSSSYLHGSAWFSYFVEIQHCIQCWSTGQYVDANFTKSLNHDRYGTHLEDLSAWAELVPEASQLLLANFYTGLRTETGAPAIRVTTTSRFSDDKRRAMEHVGEAAAAN
ncbi:hypothetical protein GGX14DRAFT_568269 [Mycena pura]|uniref:DUF6532 domain-containing protein n=1 Tax=Mycena pura TaxID=153505 RepID=A0AAD6Y905_9AGAR|nr:hypothetical protein GGX14DRAFT_568269 [Mycena pura]